MNRRPMHISKSIFLCLFVLSAAPAIQAQNWVSFADNTRYLALGDSISAGYGAQPATNGFVYQLYQSGVIDNINNTLLCNLGIPNATSKHVFDYQVQQAGLFFSNTGTSYRKVVTLTVGGNDMMQLIGQTDPAKVQEVLTTFGGNLGAILGYLSNSFPGVQIYVANQYDPRLPVAGGSYLVSLLNQVISNVVSMFPQSATVVNVFSAFEGRNGLLLIEKKGAEMYQVHPTNAGYRTIANTFSEAIRKTAYY
jgi:lysophospholipase L1-like esterase